MGLFSFLSRQPKIYTGRVLDVGAVRAALGLPGLSLVAGKAQYAEVNSAAVIAHARSVRDDLWTAGGIRSWQPNATCTLFAGEFSTRGQRRFFAEAFQDKLGTQILGLGAGDVWFHPDSIPVGGPDHAVGWALTERGLQFIDPQVPDLLRPLSASELLTIRHLRLL